MAANLADYPSGVLQEVANTRMRVSELHRELTRYKLVVWTAGNVSERVAGSDLFVIKPSGVSYDELSPEAMVVCTLDGEKVNEPQTANLRPSSDTAAHAYVYRHMKQVGGVVHTHSPYATAWAAVGRSIPCALTMMADEFGGDIPIGPFAIIGDDSIGQGIVETLRDSRSPAVLMKQHGPFTIGKSARDAVKAAVMCEEVAKTVALAEQIGLPQRVEQHHIDTLYERYSTVYGQPE